MQQYKSKGFTLVELLVVIAIIALLMSILVPSMGLVKRKAQGIVCKNNLRQYGVSTRMYLDFNDGVFPYVNTWLFNDNVTGCQWHDASRNLIDKPELAGVLWPYLKDKDIHLCPVFKSLAKAIGCPRCDDPVEPQYGYVMNQYLGHDRFLSRIVPEEYQDVVRKAAKEVNVKRASSVFLFSEENTWTIDGLSSDTFNDNSIHAIPAPTIDDCFATFHDTPAGKIDDGYAFAVFVDGHVDKVSARPLGNTFNLSWPGELPIPSW